MSEQRPGDYRVICDFSGFACWASETVKTWQGFRVRRDLVGQEAQRHPQDLPPTFPRNEGQVPWARPEQPFTFRDADAVQPGDL